MQTVRQTALLLCAAGALIAGPARAEVAGNWRVSGDISGRAFVVDCHFAPKGHDFGGTCVDTATGDAKVAGKTHVLTQGSATGNAVRWTYPTKVLFMSIDIDFAGTMAGNRIVGNVSAKGRKGTFSAVRQ